MTYVSELPKLDENRARHGIYDKAILNEQRPVLKENAVEDVMEHDIHSDELRNELWASFEK